MAFLTLNVSYKAHYGTLCFLYDTISGIRMEKNG